MDIQGAEGGALQGMYNLLKKNETIKIVTEFDPLLLKGFGIKPEDYLKLLIESGFKLYEVNEQEKKVEPVTVSELLETYTPEKRNFTNLYCIKHKDGVGYAR